MQKTCILIQGCVPCKTSPDHLWHEAKERQRDLLQPLLLSTAFALAAVSRDVQGTVVSACTNPVGRRWDLKNPFVGAAPGAVSPDWPAGVSKRREDPAGRGFYPNGREICPRAGRPFSLACWLVDAAEQVHPKDSLRATGALCRPAPGGLARWEQQGGESPPASASLCRKASNRMYGSPLGVGKLLPSPQSDRVPRAASRLQRDNVVAVKSCTRDDCAILNLSISVTPSHSPGSKGRAEPKAFQKSPASARLFPMNSSLSAY